MNSTGQSIAKAILWLEPALLVIIGIAFFYPTPTRTDWLWLLWLLLPVLVARYFLRGRILTRTPLDGLFVAFLALGVVNVYAAPYTRGLMMLARPLYGMAVYYAMVEKARTQGHLRGVLQAMIILSLLIGVLALGMTQWPVDNKAKVLRPMAEALFKIEYFPGVGGGFNANEISGAMIWLAPLMGIVMLDRWRRRETRWDVTAAFVFLAVALVLAQSRSAIVGVLVAFALAAWLLASKRWRLVALGILAGLFALEAAITLNLSTPTAPSASSQTSQGRNEASLQQRLGIWRSGLEIARDHPLTGVGLSMFRDGRVRQQYPVEDFENRILPHAHNEILQVASDMGIPGLLVYLGIHAVAVWMLVHIWRRGDSAARLTGMAAACGLLAHVVFGLADAITLWDRFAFLFWTLLGVLAAQYALVVNPPDTATAGRAIPARPTGENSPERS